MDYEFFNFFPREGQMVLSGEPVEAKSVAQQRAIPQSRRPYDDVRADITRFSAVSDITDIGIERKRSTYKGVIHALGLYYAYLLDASGLRLRVMNPDAGERELDRLLSAEQALQVNALRKSAPLVVQYKTVRRKGKTFTQKYHVVASRTTGGTGKRLKNTLDKLKKQPAVETHTITATKNPFKKNDPDYGRFGHAAFEVLKKLAPGWSMKIGTNALVPVVREHLDLDDDVVPADVARQYLDYLKAEGHLAVKAAAVPKPKKTQPPSLHAWSHTKMLAAVREYDLSGRSEPILDQCKALLSKYDLPCQFDLESYDRFDHEIGASGYISVQKGTINLKTNMHDNLLRTLTRLAAGKPVDKYAGDGLHVFVHETVHTATPLDRVAYRNFGMFFEEVTTELVARSITRDILSATGSDVSARTANSHGAYGNWVRQFIGSIAHSYGIDTEAAAKIAEDVSWKYKRANLTGSYTPRELHALFKTYLPPGIKDRFSIEHLAFIEAAPRGN